MEEASGYWCHMCSQMVNPILEIETIKCPICEGGFVEEMSSASAPPDSRNDENALLDFGLGGSDSERALSLWAPILLGMMSNPRRARRRARLTEFDNYENDENENQNQNHSNDLDQELDNIMRRRRSSAAILQLLQGIRSGLLTDPGNNNNNNNSLEMNRDNNRDENEEGVILINPFNQTVVLNPSGIGNRVVGSNTGGSLGDYFMGPGLDMLLQHLAENDPNRYGTPPARKEAVEALKTVKITETPLQCSVCLDECEIGEEEVKEMPCKHKFHKRCILPWLELHSSCPVCRYQLPFDESKVVLDESRNENTTSGIGGGNGNNDDGNNGRQFSVGLPWPFSGLFSSNNSRGNSSGNGPTGSTSRGDEV